MRVFYTYTYLRVDRSPYYVGKGHGKRAFQSHRGHRPPKDLFRIQIQFWPDEATAFAYERYQIDFWGRKDLGTGCLRNMTDGGEGAVGWIPSDRTRNLWSKQRKGFVQSLEARRNNGNSQRGKVRSPEARKRIMESKLGENNPNFGDTMLEEQKIKISSKVAASWTPERRAAQSDVGRHSALKNPRFFTKTRAKAAAGGAQ